jgi:methionine-rich copper-binding protein CopC
VSTFPLRPAAAARWTLAALLTAFVPAVAAVTRPAAAHAIVVDSQPHVGEARPQGLQEFQVRFNVRIDRDRSRLQLFGPDGGEVPLTPTDHPGQPPDLLGGSATLDRPGAWVLRWQVLAADGHITRGDIPVTVESAGRQP